MAKTPRPLAPTDGLKGRRYWALQAQEHNAFLNGGEGVIRWLESSFLGSYSTGASYYHQFQAFGAENLTYSVTSGTLPGGLTLTAEGLLAGTFDLSNAGLTVRFTLTATDGTNSTKRSFFFRF